MHDTDCYSIGTLYNAIRGQEKRDKIAGWAKAKYPDVWRQLEETGMETVDEGHGHQYQIFKIDRSVSS